MGVVEVVVAVVLVSRASVATTATTHCRTRYSSEELLVTKSHLGFYTCTVRSSLQKRCSLKACSVSEDPCRQRPIAFRLDLSLLEF